LRCQRTDHDQHRRDRIVHTSSGDRAWSAAWEFLITLNEHLRPLRDPLKIQEVALRLLAEHLQVNRVSYAYIDGDEFAISRSWVQGIPSLPGRGQLAYFGSAASTQPQRLIDYLLELYTSRTLRGAQV
jgi:hypothetical protein